MNCSIKQILQIGLGIMIGCGGYGCSSEKEPYRDLYDRLPFDMSEVVLPSFPDREVMLTDFGAKGDGITDNTEAFRRAIDSLAEQGGGSVIVPSGVWLTGPIVFRSHINLHLERGALILFSSEKERYPLVETVFEGLDTRRCQSPISGRNLENIAITGEGTIDGSGDAWRPLKREKTTEGHWKRTIARGGAFKRPDYWFPSAGALQGDTISDMNVPRNLKTEEEWLAIKDFLRPVMVNFIECRNVLLQGVLFENSPCWCLHPLMCENVVIDGITVRNPSYAQNGDGLDLESCRNVLIVNSSFDVGDDGICIKSGKDEDGRKRNRPTENVIVNNCRVFKGHGGFVVGSEMSGGVRNIWVSDCQFLGTDVGIRFKSRRGRGGVVENIWIENITMSDILTDSFSFNLYYGGRSALETLEAGGDAPEQVTQYPVTEETPAFRNIHLKDIISYQARSAMTFRGLPEMNISRIVMENITITSRYGATFTDCDDLTLKNVNIMPREGEAIIRHRVTNFQQ